MHRAHPDVRTRRLVAGLVVVVTTVTACSGSDDVPDSASEGDGVTTAPTTSAPGTTDPETTLPETTASETMLSETTDPETTTPESTVPDTTAAVDELATALQAMLDEAMAPGAVDWERDGVDAPPTLARVGVRREGHPDVLAVSGARVDGTPPDLDDPFGATTLTGSLSRTIAYQLIDEGVLDPAATIDQWAPDMPGASDITVEQVVDMRTGWSDYSPAADAGIVEDFSRIWTLEEVVALVSADPAVVVASEPTVANTAVLTTDIVLGHVLEQVTGRSLPDLVEERIALPLGLDRTLVQDGITPVDGLEAGVFVFEGSAVATSDFDATSYFTWQRATQAAVTTVSDLLDLLDAWEAGSLFTTTRTPGPERFGADRAVTPTDPTSYIGLGVPFNGYCPCRPEGAGNAVQAIGRSPGGLGSLTYLYRYADGISVVLHFNGNNAPDRTEADAIVDRMHETVVALA